MIDLLSERVGGRIVECNDEFFAEAVNLISADPPVWKEDLYTDRGKWMDGWETRRRREPGHDWCVLDLGIAGQIRRVEVDTSHFTGNYPEQFSLDVSAGPEIWHEVIPPTSLSGDNVATFDVDFPHRVIRVRLNIYPDGGVARLRVEGDPIPGMEDVCPDGATDLVSAIVGGRWLAASDYHYSPPSNLLVPTESVGMFDGWETRRRRGPGHDWATFALGIDGEVERIVVDTTHFKGNCPGWVSFDVSDDGEEWATAIGEVPVNADSVNEVSLDPPVDARFVRLAIHPDGGVARLRVMGRGSSVSLGEIRLRYLNSLLPEAAEGFFATACAASTWVARMVEARPFSSSESVYDRAAAVFDTLTADEWMEAFAGHPRIGEEGDATANREQAGSVGFEAELARLNAEYEARFGFIYIVYASRRTGAEMIKIARDRLGNDRETEITNAASEQRKITMTRLRRMLCQEDR